jgi:hypothetical protein
MKLGVHHGVAFPLSRYDERLPCGGTDCPAGGVGLAVMVGDDGEQLLAPQFAHAVTTVCIQQQLVACGVVHWLSRS